MQGIEYPKGVIYQYSNFCQKCEIEFPVICSACPNCGNTSFRKMPKHKRQHEKRIWALLDKLLQEELSQNPMRYCEFA